MLLLVYPAVSVQIMVLFDCQQVFATAVTFFMGGTFTCQSRLFVHKAMVVY